MMAVRVGSDPPTKPLILDYALKQFNRLLPLGFLANLN